MKKEGKICIIPEFFGILPIRGGIHGPIHSPSFFTIQEITKILNENIKIYEVNKNNKKNRKLLTFQNLRETTVNVQRHVDKKNISRKHLSIYAKPMNDAVVVNHMDKANHVITINAQDEYKKTSVHDKITKPDFY